ncbi:response regulator, partial [Chamaesiphon sp. OTE_20_metabat_361]|uniref:response regulator n=1 Tax=Chamaesiphon sp. OTE_20_metabat_361 TaxID=2964689 RepID=UPI00286C7AE6
LSEFNHIKASALSGNLIIQVVNVPSWMLCFSAGELAGISGGIDAIERWERNLALASLNVPLDRLVKSNNHQEIFLNSNKIAQKYVVEEVLFDIIQFSQNQQDRLAYRFITLKESNNNLKSAIPLLDIKPLLSKTIQTWQEWEQHGLGTCAPSLFPLIHPSAKIDDFANNRDLKSIVSSIDGSKSLRSLAIHHQQKLLDVAKSLSQPIEAGLITLSIARQATTDRRQLDRDRQLTSELDLVNITIPKDTGELGVVGIASVQENRHLPLIACIDDSLSVYKHLEKIIVEHGCRAFGVQDPLKILPSLIRNKPDLIFLDLVMPVTNGYEVCEQIRKTPSLVDVPIIILTGNDGLIDRVRTKFVGANGFLGKPIEARSIVKALDKYLDKKQSSRHSKSTRTTQQDRVSNGDLNSEVTKRVLVIDDDRNIREVVSMCLHKLKGWEVCAVSSGQEGLDRVLTSSPDAIVLDVMMPEMDGLAFLRQLRANTDRKSIPVILLTANRYLPDRDLLTELGVVETISKPFLPIDLVRQIDRALAGDFCVV